VFTSLLRHNILEERNLQDHRTSTWKIFLDLKIKEANRKGKKKERKLIRYDEGEEKNGEWKLVLIVSIFSMIF